MLRRRDLLSGAALLLVGRTAAGAQTFAVSPHWRPKARGIPPPRFAPGPWIFFTAGEGATVEALADRIIPPDPQTPGGKDAGCAVFVDRQLAGPYGRNAGLYVSAPFQKGMKNQGPQDELTPAARYRLALAAIDRACQARHGKPFVDLGDPDKDALIGGLETGEVKLDGVDGQAFFETLLADIQNGFFADPIYGGNRDMCAWKMIGFPGARYDYRDWVGRHNERYPAPACQHEGRAD